MIVTYIRTSNGNRTIQSRAIPTIATSKRQAILDLGPETAYLTTDGVVITDAIKFVQTSKVKPTMSTEEEDDNEPEGPNYDEDKDQLEEKQEGRA